MLFVDCILCLQTQSVTLKEQRVQRKLAIFHERQKVLSRPILVYENNHQAGKVTRQKDQRGVEVCQYANVEVCQDLGYFCKAGQRGMNQKREWLEAQFCKGSRSNDTGSLVKSSSKT